MVQQKLKKGGYKSALNLKNDLVHIFTNAKKCTYTSPIFNHEMGADPRTNYTDNQEGSGIYNDADHLHVRPILAVFRSYFLFFIILTCSSYSTSQKLIKKIYPTLLPSNHTENQTDPHTDYDSAAAVKPKKIGSMLDIKKKLDKVVRKKDNT